MNNSVKTAINIVTWVLIGAVLVVAILLAGVRLLGYEVYTVVSGSMEPDIHVGSLVYVKDIQPQAVKVGDDITFVTEGDDVVTHRVIGVDVDEGIYRFYTKGTNNETSDANPVHQNNLVGKVHFTVPLLGYLAEFIKNPPGTYIAIAFGVLLLLLVFLPDILFPEGKGDKGKQDGKEEEKPADEPDPEADVPAVE